MWAYGMAQRAAGVCIVYPDCVSYRSFVAFELEATGGTAVDIAKLCGVCICGVRLNYEPVCLNLSVQTPNSQNSEQRFI